MKKVHGKLYTCILSIVLVLCIVVGTVGSYLAFNVYNVALNGLFTSFETADTDVETTEDDWYAVAAEVESEGAVLLVNKENTLPLTGVDKVNLLGYRSYNHVYSGTGSGATDSTNAVTLSDGLAAVGITANPALTENGIYTVSFNDDTEGMGLYGRFMGAGYTLTDEPELSAFTGDCSFENLKAYSDVAIVTIGRVGGEGSDAINVDAANLDGAAHFLAISDSEKELLQQACDTFETVIVLINAENAMELGFLEDYDIDAALWVGGVGCRGMEAVAQILVGEVNPSGHLSDTYAYDATSAPSNYNFGSYTFSNYDSAYMNYAEGIYVGYRWYETADEEGYFDDVSNQYGTGYEGVVQFPFGYGLSYTEFSQEITGGTESGSTLSAGDEITIEATVTNTGDVAGKSVVQVYYSAPYTNGGLEKASVNLIDYAKTASLEAGKSETVTITFTADDMASYDETADNGNGAYVLESGEYTISIRSDAHTVLDEVTFTVEKDIVFSESADGARASDLQAASNQFADVDYGTEYLSRADGFANLERVMSQDFSVASDEVIANMEGCMEYDASYDSAVTEEYVEGVDYRANGTYVAQEGDLTLADVKGKSIDSEEMQQMLSQMSIEDMLTLTGQGGWSTAEIASIGKEYETHIDSSEGLVRVVGTTPILGIAYPVGVVQASTWNKDLIEKFASLYADEAHSRGVSGIYAPSLNIHRTPFGGRNYEYFSEDPVLSGYTAASFVQGAQSKGVIVYMKHFALNEQETNRNDVCIFCDEQAIREVYLKGFEICVEDGGTLGVMSSMNKIGGTWTGAHYGLLTEVLRNEWGIEGFVITDANEGEYMTAIDRGLRSGNDMWLSSNTVTASSATNADIYYLRQACARIIYAEANADVVSAEVAPWELYIYAFDVVLTIGAVLCVVGLVRNHKRKQQA